MQILTLLKSQISKQSIIVFLNNTSAPIKLNKLYYITHALLLFSPDKNIV